MIKNTGIITEDNIVDILLANRGIVEEKEREAFITPNYDTHMHDPFLMHDMEIACVRLFEAIEQKEKITIYADYDADGIPGAVIMHDFFKRIGYENFSIYIPHRHNEGYGLNKEAIDELVAGGTNLLITVDLGITGKEEVAYATALGVCVIVTDHHEPPEELPLAYAIVHPKLGNYPEPMLCGAGVVFKIVQAFLKKYGEYFKVPVGYEKWFLDMAGLATLADMVPLRGENRVIANYGLRVIRKNRRLGLSKLFQKLAIDARYVVEDDITFMIVPRLNAASRMDEPIEAFNLLVANDERTAGMRADFLTKINDDRKTLVAGCMRQVNKALKLREEKDLIMIGDPLWSPGILGLIAGKITDEYKKPAFVWGEANGIIKGSCRSDGSVDLVLLMNTLASDALLEFGGHEMAGGFSVSKVEIHFLEERLLSAFAKVKKEQVLGGEVGSDGEITLSLATKKVYEKIAQLAPFGGGNEKPVFLFKNLVVQKADMFGKQKNHFKIEVFESDTNTTREAIAFFKDENSFSKKVVAGDSVDLLANIEMSYFRGRPELRLRIVDVL